VLCRGATPRRSGGRFSTVGVNVEVHVAGVRVRPGDIVALDADGFVCVPAEIWEDVRARAAAVADKELARNKLLAAKE
jgi:regulator of RNase E activity RraA